jgi:hypothetical protein
MAIYGNFYGHLVYFPRFGIHIASRKIWQPRPAGLLGDIFPSQKKRFWVKLEGLNWNVLVYFGHLVHFMAILFILWQLGTFYGNLVHFMAFSYNL